MSEKENGAGSEEAEAPGAAFKEAGIRHKSLVAWENLVNANGPPQTVVDLQELILIQAERTDIQNLMVLGVLDLVRKLQDEMGHGLNVLNDALKMIHDRSSRTVEPIEDDPYNLGLPDRFDVDEG